MRPAALAFCALLALPAQALAQDPGAMAEPADGWTVTLGGAVIASPAWQGADQTAVSVFPDVRANFGDTIFASIPEGLGWNAINQDGWKAGPIAKIRFGRDEEDGGSPFRVSGDSDDLLGLGDVDAAVEVGGFVEKRLGQDDQWRVRAEVRRGFGGHEGLLGDLSLSYQSRLGPARLSVGPRLALASEDYMQTYFGIDAAQSLRSGLPTYSASGGLLSYGVGAVAVTPINRRAAVTLFAGYDRLADDAADSPLVQLRGDRDQVTIGIGFGYRFGL
jgi:outer membrane scaffolding protein for murein synthesis (MipA/OmpV family)